MRLVFASLRPPEPIGQKRRKRKTELRTTIPRPLTENKIRPASLVGHWLCSVKEGISIRLSHEARILSVDIGSIYTGQLAQVSLSAYDVSRYGNLEGHVQRIAQNTTEEQDFPPYYQTMIAIPEPKFSKSDAPVEIVPGMTVMVDIIGQKRTVLNYIMTPLNRAAGVAFREN